MGSRKGIFRAVALAVTLAAIGCGGGGGGGGAGPDGDFAWGDMLGEAWTYSLSSGALITCTVPGAGRGECIFNDGGGGFGGRISVLSTCELDVDRFILPPPGGILPADGVISLCNTGLTGFSVIDLPGARSELSWTFVRARAL